MPVTASDATPTANYWQGALVRLRAIEPADWETFARWNLDSERGRLLDFLWPPTSDAAMRAWAEAESQRRLDNDAYRWIIETLDGAAVGAIDTHSCSPRNGTFSYGIDIAREQRRRGYARAAIHLVLRWYFDELRYQKVTVSIHADNPASIALHTALGFTREGTLRRMAYSGGRYLDIHWYGLTAEEFAASHALRPPAPHV
ncbi:MAG: GNAT family N-acetyltransferase [Anaerolineae bacterium]|nr:GNAT family N-acetyltransferase [Anaerolineae bacterium]